MSIRILNMAEAIAHHLNLDVDYVRFDDTELTGQALLDRVKEVAAGIEDLVCDYTYSANAIRYRMWLMRKNIR